MYGGAGYGGKSYALRSATLELNAVYAQEGFPGEWGILMTGTYPQMIERHIGKLHEEMGHLGTIQTTKKRGLHFKFNHPALGGFFLRNASNLEQMKGGEAPYILFDEMTEAQRRTFDDMVYVRRSSKNLPFISVGAATNPDGVGRAWVKRLWVDQDFIGESSMLDQRDFVFIKARAWDNPTFTQAVAASIQGHSDRDIVRARWDGDWDIGGGVRFSQFRKGLHVFSWDQFQNTYGGKPWYETIRNEDLFTIYGCMDYGTSEESATAYYLFAVDWKGRVWIFKELYLEGEARLSAQALKIRQTEEPYAHNFQFRYCDPNLTAPESDGLSRYDKFREEGLQFILGINDRIEGWATIGTLLDYETDPTTGLIVHQPRLRIHESCVQAIEFLESAPRDAVKNEDVSRKFKKDHAGDAIRYGLHSHFPNPRERVDSEDFRSLRSRRGNDEGLDGRWNDVPRPWD